MKLIFLLGLPGAGKTTIAHLLEENLDNSIVLHLDDFRLNNLYKTKIEKLD